MAETTTITRLSTGVDLGVDIVVDPTASVNTTETVPSSVEDPVHGSSPSIKGKGSPRSDNTVLKPGSRNSSHSPGKCSAHNPGCNHHQNSRIDEGRESCPDSSNNDRIEIPASGKNGHPEAGNNIIKSCSDTGKNDHLNSANNDRECRPDYDNNGQSKHKTKSRGNRSASGKNGHPITGNSSSIAHALEPFPHQVTGHSMVFTYDASTICKSLISRELLVYQTLPDVLRPHVPEYRGVVDIAISGPQISKNSQEQADEDDDVDDDSNEEEAEKEEARERGRGRIGEEGKEEKGRRNRRVEEEEARRKRTGKEEEGGEEGMRKRTGEEREEGEERKNKRVEEEEGEEGRRKSKGGKEEAENEERKNNRGGEEEVEQEGRRKERRGVAEHPRATQRLLEKVVKHQDYDNVYYFLLLENLVSGYIRPCVLDIKLGTRQHSDDAPAHRVRVQVNKCLSTTSSLLGVRLCGMKVYQPLTGNYIKVDKMKGQKMGENDFRDAMRLFLFNGIHVRRELIPLLLMKLERLRTAMEECPTFRFYTSSVLIVYDGRQVQCTCKASNARSEQCEKGRVEQRNEQCRVDNSDSNHADNDDSTQILLSDNDSLRDRDESLKGQSTSKTIESSGPSVDACNNICSDVASNPPSFGRTPVAKSKSTNNSIIEEANNVDDGSLSPSSSTTILKGNADCQTTQRPKNGLSREQQHTDVKTSETTENNSKKGKAECETKVPKNSMSREQQHTGVKPLPEKTQNNKTKSEKARTRARVRSVACECVSRQLDVRLVDFARTTHSGMPGEPVLYQGPDQGCLLGLSTLIAIFTNIYDQAGV